MRIEARSLILLFIVFIVSTQLSYFSVECGANNDELYNLLGVSKTATTKQIRIAFKKLALEKHPDKNKVFQNQHKLKHSPFSFVNIRR